MLHWLIGLLAFIAKKKKKVWKEGSWLTNYLFLLFNFDYARKEIDGRNLMFNVD